MTPPSWNTVSGIREIGIMMESAVSVVNADVTAWLALGLAIVSILTQLGTRYLDGGRIRVRLNPAFVDAGSGGIVTITSGIWPVEPEHYGRAGARPQPENIIELAEVIVENRGRLPVTVHEIGLTWTGVRGQGSTRQAHHHVIPRYFKIESSGERRYIDEDEVRLEPYDRVSYLLDYWALLEPDRKSLGGIRTVRASAQVAGRRSPTKSSRGWQWVIPDGAVSAFRGTTKLTVRGVVTGAVIRATGRDRDKMAFVSYFSRMLESYLGGKLPEDFATRHELFERFEETHKDEFWAPEYVATRLNVMTLVESELVRNRDLIDWTDIAAPGLAKARRKEPVETKWPEWPDVAPVADEPIEVMAGVSEVMAHVPEVMSNVSEVPAHDPEAPAHDPEVPASVSEVPAHDSEADRVHPE